MVDQATVRNRLLAKLPYEDYLLLGEALEAVPLLKPRPLADADAPMAHVFFPESGIVSVVVRSPEGQSVEGGIIGREGFVAPAAIIGSGQSPHVIRTQIEGECHRIATSALVDAMRRSSTLQDRLLRFAFVSSVQTSYTLLSNAVHQIDERLARWLLMCHDRMESDDIPLTHDFMSLMLAVRRPSVTNALHTLEGNGFIRSERGYVVMRNRAALEDFAGDAYGKPEAEYRRLLGPFR